jgi:hypothetical protein
LSHLKNLAETDIVGPIAAQHCFLWMRSPAYRMTSSIGLRTGAAARCAPEPPVQPPEISGFMRN